MKYSLLCLFIASLVFVLSCKKDEDDLIVEPPITVKSTFIDTRDSKEYKYVKIKNQYWMAEDLDFRKNTYYCYDDISSNCNDYSVLYDSLDAATVCPNGWHLPSESEFQLLEHNIGFSDVDTATVGYRGDGSSLKAGGSTGFNMKLYVGCYSNSAYSNKDVSTFYWLKNGSFRRFNNSNNSIYKPNTPILNTSRFCVRCIKG